MPNFGKTHKYLFKMCSGNINVPLFHTTRNFVFPYVARGENCTDCLQCLRPAGMPTSDSDAPTLAGDPRVPGRFGHANRIEPEIYEKWNTASKVDIQHAWSSNMWWKKM